ncbi:hypothetical protein RJ639_007351, partial [Escallonia herrerae]
ISSKLSTVILHLGKEIAEERTNRDERDREMGRAPCCDKANVKKGPWSPEEDAKLKAYIEKFGTGNNWIALPQKIGLKRCGKSCRLRWLNYLRPNIKHGGFSEEEDNIICSLYISIGSRWSIIAAQLPGRTDNDIKNYWNTRLKKKLLGKRKQAHMNRLLVGNQDPKGKSGVEDHSYPASLSNSALERLQLHMQLQSLQNTFSFYNNPALWPKLNPLQEKMIQQSLQYLNQNPNSRMQQVQPSSLTLGEEQKGNTFEKSPMNYFKVDDLENSVYSPIAFNAASSLAESFSVQKKDTEEQVSTFQAELDDFFNDKGTGFLPQKGQIADFDCVKEMDVTKDSMIWWSNELETISASSTSWDSASLLYQSQAMYQDCMLGYNSQ